MRKYLIALAVALPICLASSGQEKLAWSVSQDTMRVYIQERAFDVQAWLLSNLTEEQRSQFQVFILPQAPPDDEKKVTLQQALTLIERAGGDTSDLKAQIDAIDKSAEADEPVADEK